METYSQEQLAAVGKYLASLRQQRELSPRYVAWRLGLSQIPDLYDLENGNSTSLNRFKKYARFFNFWEFDQLVEMVMKEEQNDRASNT